MTEGTASQYIETDVVCRAINVIDTWRPQLVPLACEIVQTVPDVVPEAIVGHIDHEEILVEAAVPVRIQMPWAWTADDAWSKYKIETKPGETRTRTIVVSGSATTTA